jgi:hypothetical protein
MDERVNISQLNLDRRANTVVSNNVGKIINNFFSTLKATPVIVRHFKDE